jgi:hypothetical protein
VRAWTRVRSSLLVLVSGCLVSSAEALEFVQLPGSPYATTSPPFVPDSSEFLGGEATGDFNGDGISDVAIVDTSGLPIFSPGESVTVMLGSRTGGLTMAPGSPFALYSGGIFASRGPIVAGDFNGDGKLDLAVVDESHSTVSIFLGTGTGAFIPTGSPIPFSGSGQVSMVAGDFTRDGEQDLALAAGSELTVLLGHGSGGFTPAAGSPLALPGYASSLVAGDFNGDGQSDLAVTVGSDQVAVYLSGGGGKFLPAPGSPLAAGDDPAGIAAAELTGDGELDLAIVNSSDDDVTVLLGNGAGGFAPANGSPFAVPDGSGVPEGALGLPQSIAVGDFSCDGKPDLAVANWNGYSDNVAILEGDGGGAFTNATGSPFAANGNPGPIATGDFNGDGSPDLAVVNPFQGTVTVLQNNTSGGTCRVSTPVCPGRPKGPTSPVPGPGPTGPVAGLPVIESLALERRTIYAKRGLTLEVTLSSPATVVVEFEKTVIKRLRGRKQKVLELVGSTTLVGHAGANRFAIRRVGGHELAGGTYTLAAFAELEARRSAVRTVRLIVKRRQSS